MTSYLRGQVVRANLGLEEPKLFVVVSNNVRNRSFDDVLGVRLTTTAKDGNRPSIVILAETGETRFSGSVVCDDIEVLYDDEIVKVLGAFTPQTMKAVNSGLAAALALNL